MNGPPDMVGVPEFWPTAYAVNPVGFDAIHALGPLFHKLRDQRVKGKLAATIGRLMTVTYKSIGAVTTLVFNGFDADALKIARSMFEYELIGAYLLKHPELVDDYMAFIRVSMQKDYDWMKEHTPEPLSALPEDTRNALLAELGKMDPKFRTKSGNLKPSWREEKIREMAEETGRGHIYHSVYRWASGLIHGDMTLFASGKDGIEIEPSTEWAHTALMTAHHAAVSLMEAFNEEGHLGFDDELATAVAALKDAWEPKANSS